MRLRLLTMLLSLASAACASDAESLCQDIGYCRGQSVDQVRACRARAKELAAEASASLSRQRHGRVPATAVATRAGRAVRAGMSHVGKRQPSARKRLEEPASPEVQHVS